MAQGNDALQFLELHQRLLSGDRTASEEVASKLLSPLGEEIGRKFPRTDRQIVWDGVTEAILDYCSRPNQFDAARGVPLDRFLSMGAWRNVANAVRGEVRRKARESKVGQADREPVVELEAPAGNLLREETERHRRQRSQLMERLKDHKDRKILELRMEGERRTEAFAKILGISHLPAEVQRREVKRAKDRIDKALRRRKADKS